MKAKSNEKEATSALPRTDVPNSDAPIKLPDPPEEQQAETPKVGSRDAPGG